MSFQPPISAKQAELLNDTSRYILVTGARYSTKSFAVMHDLAWHLWKTPGAVGMMIGKTVSQNADSGLWTLLTKKIIPEWIAGDFGLEWVTLPKMDGVSHRMFFDVSNEAGGTSRMYLESLDVERDIELKFKGRIASYLYLTEGDNFIYRNTFDVLQECLRLPHLRAEQHRFVIDCNPPDSGYEHWLGKLFFWFRELDLDTMTPELMKELQLEGLTDAALSDSVLALKELQEKLSVHQYSIDDNIWLDDAGKRAQRAKYSHNLDLYNRYYRGLWVKSSGEGIFSEVLRDELHILGESPRADQPEDIILLQDDCIEIGLGFDIGSRRNTAVSFIEPMLTDVEVNGQQVTKPSFSVIDEWVQIGVPQGITEMVDGVMEKMEFWEKQAGKKIRWEAWSDSSAFSYDMLAETYEAKEVYRLSGGTIELRSVTTPRIGIKGHGGVLRRVNLLYRLLFEHRIVFSRARCPHHIEMLNGLRYRRDEKTLNQSDKLKHVFDSCTYFLAPRCWDEMQKMPRLRTMADANQGLIVTRL